MGLSCDESLPPPEVPRTVLSGTLTVIQAGDIVVVRDGLPIGTMGAIQIDVTNVYDEVLQDSSILEGRVEIWMKDKPDVRAEVLLTDADLVTYRMLRGRYLTIGVDSTMVLLKQWSHHTVTGEAMWDHVRLYPAATTGGEPYCVSDPITFVVRCSLRVFKSSGQIQFPDQEVQLTYHVFGIQCR